MFAKKGLCVLLALVMAFSIMAGCTANGTNSVEKTTATVAQETSGQKEEKQLEPLSISIVMTNANNAYLAAEKNINENKYVKKINELANVKLNITLFDHNKAVDLTNLMYASGEVPDVYMYGMTPVTETAIREGVYLNLKEYINEEITPNILEKTPAICWKSTDVLMDGGIYYLPRFSSVKSGLCTFVREDLLKKYNLEVPETLDEYLNVMRVFKQNGVKYPTSGRENFTYMYNWFGAFGVSPDAYTIDKEGKLVPQAITTDMKNALSFLRQIYQEGLLDPEFLSNTGSVWLQKCNAGEVGIFNHQVNRIAKWVSDIQVNVPDANLIMLPGPKGPDGKMGSQPSSAQVVGCIFINKNVKDPVRLMKFFDWAASDEAQEFFQLGIEGDTYKKVDGKIEFTYPTDVEGSNELLARVNSLNFLGDSDVRKFLMPFMPYGNETLEYLEKYGSCAVPVVMLLGKAPEIYSQRPELYCGGGKDALWTEIAAKIVYGSEPIDAFDAWVENWKSRGGDIVLQQLEEKRKAGEYLELN